MKALSFLGVLAAFCACAAPQPAAAGERAAEGPYQVELLGDYGQSLRTFDFRGRTWVMGQEQQRYRIRVHNRTGHRVEAVVSVDGRDAIDGKPGTVQKPGYIIGPWGSVTIDGFRLNMRDVATFRFSSVPDSYAAQMGNAREVGVIGVAIFQERYVPPPPAPIRQREYPGDAEDERDHRGDYGRTSEEPRSSAPRGGAEKSAAGAPAPRSERAPAADGRAADRPGLGTQFGERRAAPVVQVDFARARAWRPDALLALRYNDRQGLLAMGIEVDPPRRHWWHEDPRYREQYRRETARPFADAPRAFAEPPVGWDD